MSQYTLCGLNQRFVLFFFFVIKMPLCCSFSKTVTKLSVIDKRTRDSLKYCQVAFRCLSYLTNFSLSRSLSTLNSLAGTVNTELIRVTENVLEIKGTYPLGQNNMTKRNNLYCSTIRVTER